MKANANRKQYPYTKNRVFLSVIIALLSTILAITLLLSDTVLVLYYCFSTFIAATVTFFLKKRFYALLTTDNQPDADNNTKHSTWKMLLAAALMLIGSIAFPLLMAMFLSAPLWFVMITSFMSGVSISEIVLYLQAQPNLRARTRNKIFRLFKIKAFQRLI